MTAVREAADTAREARMEKVREALRIGQRNTHAWDAANAEVEEWEAALVAAAERAETAEADAEVRKRLYEASVTERVALNERAVAAEAKASTLEAALREIVREWGPETAVGNIALAALAAAGGAADSTTASGGMIQPIPVEDLKYRAADTAPRPAARTPHDAEWLEYDDETRGHETNDVAERGDVELRDAGGTEETP